MLTTVGQVMVNSALPPEYRDYSRVMSKGDTDKVLAQVADRNPEKYREIAHKLMQLGRHASFEEGTTLRLRDLVSGVDKKSLYAQLDKDEAELEGLDATDDERTAVRDSLYEDLHGKLKQLTYDSELDKQNPMALQVKSKARGSADQLTSLMTSPGTYQDNRGRTIPVFIRRSYAEGLDPHEYYAATYGARVGTVGTKDGTRRAGYLGKLIASASIDQVVTEDDCGTPYGIPVRRDDDDNIGSVLARDTGKYDAGTVLTRSVLNDIKDDEIMVRSPITCGTGKGLCKRCVGIREHGKFPDIGYNVGLNASSAVAEQLAQASLNTKHSGKKAKGQSNYSGFDVIKNLATVPSTFPNAATVAATEGTVESIAPAPQGGFHVTVNGEDHYVHPDMDVTVKVGDTVEAGDALSQGVVNPSDVVKFKGLGEGRRYFATRFTQAMRDSNYGANRRNVEVLARSMVNHVSVDDMDAGGQHLPGDIVTYSSWAYGYKPRKDAVPTVPKKAIGQYLEQPALHYTIGTRVTKSMANQMQKYGIDSVIAHPQPVGVTPDMQSVVNVPSYSEDWMARLGSSYLKTRLLEDVQAGAVSHVHGLNPIPGIAKATEFGQQQKGKGFAY